MCKVIEPFTEEEIDTAENMEDGGPMEAVFAAPASEDAFALVEQLFKEGEDERAITRYVFRISISSKLVECYAYAIGIPEGTVEMKNAPCILADKTPISSVCQFLK